MTDLMKKYRGTVVGVGSLSKLPQMLRDATKEINEARRLQVLFPHGSPVVAECPYGEIIEGNVIRYDGRKREICILDESTKEEFWCPVNIVTNIKFGKHGSP